MSVRVGHMGSHSWFSSLLSAHTQHRQSRVCRSNVDAAVGDTDIVLQLSQTM